MAVDTLDPCGVYFGTTGGQVYGSADAGDSWAPIVRDLPPVLVCGGPDTAMIRVVLPTHLRTLARVDGEVQLHVEGPVTQRAVLDALEARYPMLRGTIRDHGTQRRRLPRERETMPDFTLEPDEIERPTWSSPVRMVSTGLHPTAEVPPTRRKDRPPVHVPCEACGTMAVIGVTESGTRLALDPHVKTYTILWHHEAEPALHESRSYPVHRCVVGGPQRETIP